MLSCQFLPETNPLIPFLMALDMRSSRLIGIGVSCFTRRARKPGVFD